MKYKCFCATDYWSLTKDEIKHMIRGQLRRFEPKEFIEYYNIEPKEFRSWIMAKGLQLASRERQYISSLGDTKVESKNGEISYNPFVFAEIPNQLICALYEVDVEVKDGKLVYDSEQFIRAKDDIEKKINRFEEIIHPEKKEENLSKLKPIDLVAMRIFRGLNRREFSRTSRLDISIIQKYESNGAEIPLNIERTYKEVLSVKKRHIVQLRDIMLGKTKEITDDRTIPKLIKLKVWKRDDGKCTSCGSKQKLHYHHIKRFSEGGQHVVDNLKMLCASCHAEEHKGEQAYYMLKKMAEG